MDRKQEKWCEEMKKMCKLSIPAILILFFQYSISFVTSAFVGHLGEIELAAVSLSEDVISWFAYAILGLRAGLGAFQVGKHCLKNLLVLLGMGSALETLCGQAVGAGQTHLLGIYLQRSWIISLITAILLSPIFIFTTQILKFLGQPGEISQVAEKFSRWIIPHLFAFAINFPMQNFYLSQSKVWVLTVISFLVLGLHILLNYLFVVKLGHGLIGAAIVSDVSWWILDFAEFVCLFLLCFGESWQGFSKLAFRDLGAFVRLSLSSAVMSCLELWYYTAFSILVGLLQNPEIMVGAFSICMNYELWTSIFALGFSSAVRISNELGANNPDAPELITIIGLIASSSIGAILGFIVYILRNQLPRFFTDRALVINESAKLSPLLSAAILLGSIQQIFSGVAIGAGWQKLVTYINIASFYLVGLPIGALLGLKYNMKALGIWTGMLVGLMVETICLLILTFSTKWKQEVKLAENRMKLWGGQTKRVEVSTNLNEEETPLLIPIFEYLI